MPDPCASPVAAERSRLRRSALLHGLAVLAFGLLGWSGAALIGRGVPGLAVPSLVAGTAGSAGALVILVAVLRRRAGRADRPTPARPSRFGAQGVARASMALAAVVTVVAGVAFAPAGMDRGFVISVAGLLGGARGWFALLAGEQPRADVARRR